MTNYSIEYKGLNKQLSKLKYFDNYFNQRLTTAMKKTVNTVEANVKPLTPVGVSSRLRNSIGSEVIVEAPGSIIGRVGSSLKSEKYPQVMEYGRKPGTMPPPSELLRWVHLKIRPEPWKEYNVALNIARKIKARGIKGKHFMRDGFKKSKALVNKYFSQAGAQLVKDLKVNE